MERAKKGVRHHCRKCGMVFCDDCTAGRLLIHPAEVVFPPDWDSPLVDFDPAAMMATRGKDLLLADIAEISEGISTKPCESHARLSAVCPPNASPQVAIFLLVFVFVSRGF